MKLTKYITTACIAALFTGCDYLDFDETTGMTKEEMYSYFGNVTSLSTFVYSQLPQDFGAIGDALRDAATDNAVYTWNQSSVYNVYNGTWSPLKTVDDVWSNYYTAIREANSFLENYSLEVLERFKWNVDYEIDVEKAKMRVHEVRALRAFFYLELAKRYGDIPLLTRTYQIDEINSVEKTPFDKVIDFIVDECDKAAPELPVSYKDFYNETGRATRGMAMSVKARALLYAASKLHNPSHDTDKWKKAAKASYDIIKTGWYTLPN
ncbi:RagB/SusD family nutrient uptake outer membrane protein, partial [Bacteroides ovatus]